MTIEPSLGEDSYQLLREERRPQKSLLGFGLEEEVCSLVHSCPKPGERQERAEGLPALQVWEKSSGLLEGWIPSRMKDLEALAPPAGPRVAHQEVLEKGGTGW